MIKVSSLTSAKVESLDVYNKALFEYKKGNFNQALEHFKAVLKVVPGDTVSLLYVERCELYIKEPPPSDWDGVFVAKTK